MTAYILRRLLLMIPTLWAIITLNFFIIQIAPGGPVEQQLAIMQGIDNSALDRVSGSNQSDLQDQAAPLLPKVRADLHHQAAAKVGLRAAGDRVQSYRQGPQCGLEY